MIDVAPHDINDLLNNYIDRDIKISFPNGEYEPLTNDNIVSESFTFTESINSSKKIKFGLCEASMVEFETIGLESIKGLKIKVEYIISYSKNDAIETCKIPIGVFTVYESKRKQGSLHIRKIVAYSNIQDKGYSSSYVEDKSVIQKKNRETNKLDIVNTLFECNYLYSDNLEDISQQGVNQVIERMYTVGDYIYSKIYTYKVYTFSKSDTEVANNKVFRYPADDLEGKSKIIYEALSKVPSILTQDDASIIDITDPDNPIDLNTASTTSESVDLPYYKSHCLVDSYVCVNFMDSSKDPLCYAKLRFDNSTVFFSVGNIYPQEVVVKINSKFELHRVKSDYSGDVEILLSLDLVDRPLQTVDISEFYPFKYQFGRDDVIDSDVVAKMAESYFELNGMFVKSKRQNGTNEMAIVGEASSLFPDDSLYPDNTLYPLASCDFVITKDLLIDFYLDDEDTDSKYRMVAMNYTNSDSAEKSISLKINEYGNLIYDLSENWIVKNIKLSDSNASNILQVFANRLSNYQSSNSQIKCAGLPFIESGDLLYIITDDGGFMAIVNNRTFSGIKSIIDTYESY